MSDNNATPFRFVSRLHDVSSITKLLIVSFIVYVVSALLFTHTYDSVFWVMIMDGIETGNGLYGINGLYYTPVWGYILSFYEMLISSLPLFGSYGERFTELLPYEAVNGYAISTVINPLVSMFVRVPLIICAIVVGKEIHGLVFEFTGDEKKSIIAAAFWCLCPLTIYMTAVQAQFEALMILLVILCLSNLRKERFFLAGVLFALAVWLKTFPVLILLILIGYVIVRRSEKDGVWIKDLIMSMAGAILTTVILFVPVAMNGELSYAFSFLTARQGSFDISSMVIPAVIVLLMILTFVDLIKEKCAYLDQRLYAYSFMIMAWGAIIVSGYQYLPIVIFSAILVYYICPVRTLVPITHLVWVVGIIDVMIWELYSALYISSEYFGLFDPAMIVRSSIEVYDFMQSLISPIGNIRSLISTAAVVLLTLGAIIHKIPRLEPYLKKGGTDEDR